MANALNPNQRQVTRRQGIAAAIGFLSLFDAQRVQAKDDVFIAEAARQRDAAVAAGDQPYGAVLVLDGRIVGTGRSRVVADRNPDAHAERVALWDAQRRLERMDLSGALIFATSPPCAICQRALAAAGVSQMRVGPDGRDHGAPRGSSP